MSRSDNRQDTGAVGEQSKHIPVMVSEVLEFLRAKDGGRFVDATVGYGGHSERLLEANPATELIGIDRDEQALDAAETRLQRFGDRVQLFHNTFSNIEICIKESGWDNVDGVLLDLGVSSPQLDDARRGFSLRFDGPLDMRMNRKDPNTAATLLNQESEEELARIFREYGEEPRSRRLARAVVARRRDRPWERTGEFAEFVGEVLGHDRRTGLPRATRTFQALRIALNHELQELRAALATCIEWVRPGGRMVVISFHSLEDRIVKHYFREQARGCTCPTWFPECRCGKRPTVKVLTRRPVRPGPPEVDRNRRARPARLRAAERIEESKTIE